MPMFRQKRQVDNFPLTADRSGHLRLKNHNHFCQCLELLLVTKKEWVDYLLRTQVDIFIERVGADEETISPMSDKLTFFYGNAILPELALP